MNLSRNIVIEASAGTGKTYTLVQTILQALFEKNLPMEALVAMTFTKKAAGEMKERIAAELGDLLFCVANLAFLMKVQPEDALRGNLARFEQRFRHVEKRLAENGRRAGEADLEEMDRYWEEAKELEKA